MTIQSHIHEADFVAKITNVARDAGIELQVGDDFTDYAEAIFEERPEQVLGDPFNCARQYIEPGSGFWIMGRNAKRELVHTQAMKRVELGGTRLGPYLQRNYMLFPPPWSDIDQRASGARPGPSSRRISGQVVYHGDVWLKSGPEYRGTGIVGALTRLAMSVAWARFSPDYIFGFISAGHSNKGLAEREGYMHCEPDALTWATLSGDKKMSAYMVHNSREDIEFMMELPVAELAA